ncbi:MAG: ABC transporter permease, partial [Clostridiales bacterium]|nr:ABC transporter permease [Clostridiales bacterium]
SEEDYASITNLCFILLPDYNRWEGTDRTLGEGEVLLYSTAGEYPGDTLRVYDAAFSVKEELPSFSAAGIDTAQPAKSLYVIVKDMAALDVLGTEEKVALWGERLTSEGEQLASPWRYVYAFDVPGATSEAKLNLRPALNEAFSLDGTLYIESREGARDSDLGTYGGLFFVGVFLGALFLAATALIIYYKQVSEGYDDRRRYEIMQQVGMSHVEVKQSIGSQIRLVFFLPLATACVHMAFAFPVVTRMLQLFDMNDAGMFALVCLGVVGVFALIYLLVYSLTARTYYKIVS